MPKSPTSYKGLLVTESEKEQLKNQPIGNFLRYEKEGDNYIIQQKFPTVGRYKGEDFNPQRGMNAFLKGVGSLFDNENKIIDYDQFKDKFSQIDEVLEAASQLEPLGEKGAAKYEKCMDVLLNFMKVPKEETQNTKTFMKSLGSNLRTMFLHVSNDVDDIRRYNTFVEKIDEIPENEKENYKEFIHDNKDSVKRLQDRLLSFNKINIAENDKLIYSSDCSFSAKITEIVARSFNEYCDSHEEYKDKKLNGRKEEFHLEDAEYDKEKEELNFDIHSVFGENVTLDGKKMYLTLETTAPGVNDLVHEPGDQKTGVGLYESKDEAFSYYKKANVTEKPKIDKYHFNQKELIKTTHPIVDKKQLESMKPKEPNGFFKFCHNYLHLFNDKFKDYNAKLEKYEQTKKFFEAEGKISKDIELTRSGHKKD